MKKEWVCSKCGESTLDVDMDYLMGYDHISCLLKVGLPKLQNWNKLEGQEFDVMGVTMRMQNAEVDNEIDRYTVWLIDTEVTTEPLMRVDMYLADKEIDIKTFIPDTFGSPPHHTRKKITKDHIKDPSIFIQTIGMMMMGEPEIRKVLDYLSEIGGNIGARSGMRGGIVNHVLNSGITITFGSASLW
jgi:hypothetical protein